MIISRSFVLVALLVASALLEARGDAGSVAAMEPEPPPQRIDARASDAASTANDQQRIDDEVAKATDLIDNGSSDELEQAKHLLDDVLQLDPRQMHAHMQMARYDMNAAYASGSGFRPEVLDHANDELAKALVIDPGNADVYVLLGKLRSNQRRREEAVEALEKARTIGTTNPWLYINLYEAYSAIGRWDLAENCLRVLDDDRTVHAAITLRMRGLIDEGWLRVHEHRHDMVALEADWSRLLGAGTTMQGEHAMFLLAFRNDADAAIDELRKVPDLQDEELARHTLGLAQYVKWAELRKQDTADADAYRRQARENLGEYADALVFAAEHLGDSRAIQTFALAVQSEGISLDAPDSNGFTAMDYAVMCGCVIEFGAPASITWLLDHGARVDARDAQGQTPMLWASSRGIRPAFEVLIARGADVTVSTPVNGLAPIHLAARVGDTTMLRALLARGVKVDSRDDREWTPLMYAARTGSIAAVEMLLDAGADPAAIEQTGKNAELMATNRGYSDIAAVLRAHAKQ